MFGSAPPDYGFDYGDERPWAWETGDRYVRYAEPIDQGYRYYYYGPDSDQPYLVRDPWYSYGYRDGRLAQIYGRDGRVLDARRALVQRRMADRYYARALAMRRAAESERHQGVSAQNWARHRVAIARAQDDWDRDAARRPGWEQWNDRHAPVVAARWTQERAVRRFAGDRFARWQQAGFRGKSPDFYREAADDSRLQRDIRTQRQQAVRQAQMQARIGDVSRQDNREQDRQRERQAQREQVQREQQQRLIAARTQRQQMQQQRQSQAREASMHRQQAARMQQHRQSQAREASDHRQQAARMQQQRRSQAREAAVHRQQAARVQQQRRSQAREASVHRQQAARVQQQRQSQAREAAVHHQQAARAQQHRQSQMREASMHRQQAARAQQQRQAQARQAQARQAQSRPHGGGHGGPRDGHGGGHPGHP
ncbi:hypothetical protein [Novosphingobium sp. 9]|uniref:hypothetical protein n=1 Tax=Novosphingobium sp. 9 TaxID=2025349 RepID=UPI0021B55A72|nr:hypothetical protein [Novosphingobium sp. 9]